MPLRNRSLITGPSVFFLTTTTFNRTRFPGYPESLTVVQEIMFQTILEKKISLFGYCVMPSHVHMIVGSKNGGKGISDFVHSLKGRIRINIRPKGILWQKRFDDLLLKTDKQFEIKLNYIHNNPVKDALCDKPEDWPFSSFIDWRDRTTSKGIVFDFDEFYE